MNRQLMMLGGRIDAVFFCPHTPDEGCDCRKPQPGLLTDIGRRYGADLSDVPVVGDTLRDLQAAQAAGCPPHLVLTGRAAALDDAELSNWVAQVPGTQVHENLPAFAEWLLTKDRVPHSAAGSLNA
jgi:D-glycero-D-manno-heptose 1,7-bisphosphate phosphatase